MALFGQMPNLELSPRKLAELADSLCLFLDGLSDHNRVIDRCPNQVELDRAVVTGKIEELHLFFDQGDRTLRRHEARQQSHAALDQLKSYFDELWIGSRRSAIEAGRSNASAGAHIMEALSTLKSFQ